MHLAPPPIGLDCYPFKSGGFVVVDSLLIVDNIVGFCNCCNHLDGEERAGCFPLFVFLVSQDCCVALPQHATGLSAICNCGIS